MEIKPGREYRVQGESWGWCERNDSLDDAMFSFHAFNFWVFEFVMELAGHYLRPNLKLISIKSVGPTTWNYL